MPEQTRRNPLVVFGFDAGDPRLMNTWAEDGSLPTLGSLMKRGCWGRTAGPEMISEHGIWSTLVSGVSRAAHGYYYHRQLVPRSYGLAPARGPHITAPPFWCRLPADLRIAIIDVPDVAEPAPQAGIQVSEWATHYPLLSAIDIPFRSARRGPRDIRSSDDRARRSRLEPPPGLVDLRTIDAAH